MAARFAATGHHLQIAAAMLVTVLLPRRCSASTAVAHPKHPPLVRTAPFHSAAIRMMPEGPEVRRLAERMHEAVGGGDLLISRAEIVSGRYTKELPKGWGELCSRLPLRIVAVRSRGKFMFFELEDECSLWSTLGLTGWWCGDATRAHTRVILRLERTAHATKQEAGVTTLAYSDARNFGTLRFVVDRAPLDAKLRKLGLPWLGEEQEVGFSGAASSLPGASAADWPTFRALVERTTARYPERPVAVWLMDQSKTAGVGNYILSEALYRARISPFATCGALSLDDDWRELHAAVRSVMLESLGAQGELWRTKFRLAVYGRQVDPEGRQVQRALGPHGRAVWLVDALQQRGAEPTPT